jgi:AcrR family transcriptional regulator
MSVTEGLRERKKAETRRAMSSAALRLALEHGPDGVTIEAIAEAAGVSPRTFFNYFASKDDAIVGVAPAEASELLRHLVDQPADASPLDALRNMCRAMVPRLEESADDLWARHQLTQEHPYLAARRNAAFAEVEHRLAAEIARRTGRDLDRDPYPMVVVTAASGALKTAVAVWQERGRTEPLADVLEEAFRHVEAGFVVPVALVTGAGAG